MDETEKQPLISCVLTVETGTDKRDHVTAELWDDRLSLSAPDYHLDVSLSSLSGVRAQNYRVFLNSSGSNIVLSMIGHLYEDFARRFIHAFNEVLFNESLMKEQTHFETEGYYTSTEGKTSRAVLRVCETALVVLPETHSLLRIPFCMIAKTDVQPYQFSITDRLGRTYILSKMGYSTDAFMHAYRMRLTELVRQTREKLSVIAPADDNLAMLLLDGLVQPVSDIRAISEYFADAIGITLADSEIANEYGFLREVSDNLAIGIKRGLMGELTGECILVIAPVSKRNVLIMESLGDSSAATYVFRLFQNETMDEMHWRRFLLEFNESMLSVNFRREPVYLSDEALHEARYETYANALRRVPALARLRSLYLGRAVHSGFESWKNKIESFMQ